MTLDEAIKHAEEVTEEKSNLAERIRDNMKSEIALSNADECETCADEHRQLAEWLKDYKQLKEQQPNEDCVSRQAVLEKINDWWGITSTSGESTLCDYIRELPSVAPTRKKGKWIYVGDNCFKCSECGEVYTVDQFNHINNYCNDKFPKACPSCATEMESE